MENALYILFILFLLPSEFAKPLMHLFPTDINPMSIIFPQQAAGRVCDDQHLLA